MATTKATVGERTSLKLLNASSVNANASVRVASGGVVVGAKVGNCSVASTVGVASTGCESTGCESTAAGGFFADFVTGTGTAGAACAGGGAAGMSVRVKTGAIIALICVASRQAWPRPSIAPKCASSTTAASAHQVRAERMPAALPQATDQLSQRASISALPTESLGSSAKPASKRRSRFSMRLSRLTQATTHGAVPA